MRSVSVYEKENKLYISNYSFESIVKKYDSPVMVFDEAQVRYNLDMFKNNFKSDKLKCNIIYASKAFFAPYFANIINEYGFYMDSVSAGDMYMIKHANFPFSSLYLHGNNKTEEELRYAINNDAKCIIVDNYSELKLLASILEEKEKTQEILIRLNPGISAHTHEYIQTSLLYSKFGESIYDKGIIHKIANFIHEHKNLKFKGFHCHIGSSINEEESFVKASNHMMDFIKEFEKEEKLNVYTLDLGGGFGIRYLESDKLLNLPKCLKDLVKNVEEKVEMNNLHIEELLIEPGRSIVGNACFTLYKAGTTKTCINGKNYLFLDGGMTDNIRPALYQAKYTCENASAVNGEKMMYDLVGPCCESGDIIAKDASISKATSGDIIVCYCTGAYGYTMSSNYNGHVRPNVIFVKNDSIHLAIRREDYNDLTKQFPIKDKIGMHKIFDMHSDMLYDLWSKKSRGIKDTFTNYHVNQLHNSVIHGAVWTMYSEFDFDLVEACKIALSEIKMEKLSDFNVVLGLEGLRNLKKAEDIDILYDMGFRHAMLTWNEENIFATGAKSDPTHGLKEEGIKLLKRMEEKGMIIDLAHTNEKSFYDILKYAKKNIIFSHGNCKALCPHVRNVTDDQMRALKEVDGLLGLTLADNFIAEKKEERTFEKFMEHVKHAIDIMGVDNVGFGFDFMDYLSEFPNSDLYDVKDATLTYRIVEGLYGIGLNDEEIDKVCYYNFYNRFKDKIVLKGTRND